MIGSTVILGAGNVAFHLTQCFIENGIEVVQLYNRSEKDAQIIAEKNQIAFTTDIKKFAKAEFYLITATDDAIGPLSSQIPYENALVAHTAGSVSIDVLNGNFRKAVFYPLQTFSKEVALDYAQIPFFIEATHHEDEKSLLELADKISAKARVLDSDKRLQLHISAVFVNNFSNHLFALANELSSEIKIGFSDFNPLLEETFRKLQYISPKIAQTGPARRHDKTVIEKHLNSLTNSEIKKIYATLTQSIEKMYPK